MTDAEIVAAAAAEGITLNCWKPRTFHVLKVVAHAALGADEHGFQVLVRSSYDHRRILRRRYKRLTTALRAIREKVPTNPNGYGIGVRVLATINPETGRGYAWSARNLRERLTGACGVIVGGVGEPTGNWQVKHDKGVQLPGYDYESDTTWWDETELAICPEGDS